MIVLSKKKMLTVFSIIMLFGFAYVITGYNVNTIKNKTKTVETVAFPVNNRVIVLDAGHGVPDERCTK